MKPTDGYISYIVNPKSGASGTRLIEHRFRAFLVDAGYDLRVELTNSLRHARELANDAAVDFECALVVAVGGDGTVREVAHGLEGSDKPLMIVPCGTENLLASELGFDEKLSTLIETFNVGFTRPLDLGNISDRCFTCVAGFGFDGDVVDKFHQIRNGHTSHMDYFGPIWSTFWSHRFQPIKVTVDGEEIFDGKAMVFVGNVSRYALGLQILSHADYGDGLLDICIYKCPSRWRIIKHAFLTVLKRHAASRDVIYKQGKSIEVASSGGHIRSEIDGDPGPDLPAKIDIIPRAVNVVVPEHGKPAGMRTRVIRAIG